MTNASLTRPESRAHSLALDSRQPEVGTWNG